MKCDKDGKFQLRCKDFFVHTICIIKFLYLYWQLTQRDERGTVQTFKSEIMKAISEIRNLTRARNAEHYRLQEALLKAITAEFATKYGFSALRDAYIDAFATEDSLYLQSRGFIDTKSLKAKDAERDKLFRHVKLIIQGKTLSLVETETAAATVIAHALKPYVSAARKPDAENTAMVSDFVKKLQSSEYSSYVETLGLTEAVAALKTANDEYDELYSHRADEKRVRAVAENLENTRKVVDAAFVELANAINAVYAVSVLIEKDATKEAEIGAVIDAMNAEILQFAETLSRRGVGKKTTISSDDTPVTDGDATDGDNTDGGSEDDVPELM